MDKSIKVIPFKGMLPQCLFHKIGVLLGGFFNGPLSFLPAFRLDENRTCQGHVVAVPADAKREKYEERRTGQQGKNKRCSREIGVTAEEGDTHLALIASPDDISGNRHQAPGSQDAKGFDRRKG